LSDWFKEHSEAIWTTVTFGVLFVGIWVGGFEPGYLAIFFMGVVAYALVTVLFDFVKFLDPELEQYRRPTSVRGHIWALGASAIVMVAWSTFKVEPLPAGVKLDMEQIRTTARILGVGIITGLVTGGLIAAAQSQSQSARIRDE
jgi:hypothetical protein